MSTVQERPILMSAPMVRAILEGRKTQTRRVLKGSTEFKGPYNPAYLEAHKNSLGWKQICPDGRIGEKLWVRETWRPFYEKDTGAMGVAYRAGGFKEIGLRPSIGLTGGDRWRPSIFLPRWASRITLEITDVRVQRVQDISEEESEAEGIDDRDALVGQVTNPFITAYAVLWDSIYGKSHPWSDNPWVWAIAFKRLEK